jgi:hypothetical protein
MICMCVCTMFLIIHLVIHSLAIVKRAAINMSVQASVLYVYLLFLEISLRVVWWIPKLVFWRSLHAGFHSGCTSSHSQQLDCFIHS